MSEKTPSPESDVALSDPKVADQNRQALKEKAEKCLGETDNRRKTMVSKNKSGNRFAAVLAILVLVVADLSAYMMFLSSEGGSPSRQPSPHAIDQSN